jgi:NLR family CARD domain-containing protein 3
LGNFTSEGINAIADAIRVNGALTELCIDGNYVGDEGVSAVCEAIQSNKETKLASLYFRGNGIGPVGANAVAAMVAVTGALTKLSLAWNELGEEGTKAICEALKQNKTLKELDLSGRDNIGGEAGAEHVADMLGVNDGLTRVDVNQNNMAGGGAVQLAAAVLGNFKIEIFNKIPIKEMRANSLTELDLNGKDVGVEGGMVIAGLIPVMGGLTKLSLAQNMLREEGTKAICEALEQNTSLKELDICGSSYDSNIRGSAGARHVAKMVGVNGGLTSINLSGNHLTNHGTDMTGIKELAAALGVNGGLTKISLAKNMLGEEGTKAICEALEQNKTLKELDISGDGFGASNIGGSAGVKHVAKMLGVNGGLTSINMSGNNLTDSGRDMTGIKELAAALGVNGALTQVLAF